MHVTIISLIKLNCSQICSNYGEVLKIRTGMTKDILEVTFRHHFQAVDAVKGINYLFGKSDIA